MAEQLSRFGLIRRQKRDVAENFARELASGSRIEDGERATSAGKIQNGGDGLKRRLQLQKHQIAAVEMRQPRECGVGRKRRVRAGRDDDGILTGVQDGDARGAGGTVATSYTRGVDTGCGQ